MGGYSGNAGNSLINQNRAKWTTFDQDNDGFWIGGNCASVFGPNWHAQCCKACLLNKATNYFWRDFNNGPIDAMKWMIR